jgi:Protein of unknown function (DUF433)
MDWSACAAVDRSAGKLGGKWCFLLDQGSTIDEFVEWFPSVNQEQAHQVLAFARSSLEQPAAVA